MIDIFYPEHTVQPNDAYKYSDYKDLFLLEDLGGREVRNIAIMYIKSEYKNNVKYLLILGVDIFTQKMIRLVDTYGMKYGLCRYCEDYKDLRIKTVIKVPCKICNDSYLNALRIVGKPMIIGKTNFNSLIKKFRATVFCGELFLPFLKLDVPCFIQILKNNPEKEFYARVSISSTIKKYQGEKYQVKFSAGSINRFADIIDERFINEYPKLDNCFIKAVALVKGKNVNGRIRVYVVKIYEHTVYKSLHEYEKTMMFEKFRGVLSMEYIERLLDEGYDTRKCGFFEHKLFGQQATFIDEEPSYYEENEGYYDTGYGDSWDYEYEHKNNGSYLMDNSPYENFSELDEIQQAFLNRDY